MQTLPHLLPSQAVNEETGLTVAIKKIRKVGMRAEQSKAVEVRGGNASWLRSSDMPPLQQEIELTKTLKHPNIVDVIGSMEDKNYIYLILEYVDGGSLASLVKD